MEIRHLVATAAILALLAIPARAAGDCQPAGPLAEEVAEAPLVFVGTALETRDANGAPPVTLRVEEVWAGRYLVVPILDGNVLRDGICSATTEWQPGLAELRPNPAPVPVGSSGAFPLLPLVAGVAVVAVLLAAFFGYDWIARRQRA